MATYLQLCQDAARESGVVSGTNPLSVIGQTGTLGKIVVWIRDSWIYIQQYYDNWEWMRADFSFQTISGTGSYTPSSINLTDHDHFLGDQPDYRPVSLYLTTTGISDTSEAKQISYSEWKTKYGRGTQTNAKPYEYALSPLGAFLLGPIPDAAYTVNGEYYKKPQVFTTNTDNPTGLAEKHHPLIWKRALVLLATHDEAPQAIQSALMLFDQQLDTLRLRAHKVTMRGNALA